MFLMFSSQSDLAVSAAQPPRDPFSLRYRYYDPTIGQFTSFDEFGTHDITEPTHLNKYLYAGADPINQIDPSGHDFFSTLGALAIGTSLRGITIGAVVGAAFGGAGYLISTPFTDWTLGGALAALGKGALWGAFGSTLIGSAVFAGQAIWDGVKVWRDPNSTGLQKGLASVNIIVAGLSSWMLSGQVRSQIAEWNSVYSKIPLGMEVQRDLNRIKQAFAKGDPIKIGDVTIYFGDQAGVAGGVIVGGAGKEFFLTKDAFNRGNDELMKTIIEENLHAYRIEQGLVEGAEAVAGGGGDIRQEETVVQQATDLIFKIGRERKWW